MRHQSLCETSNFNSLLLLADVCAITRGDFWCAGAKCDNDWTFWLTSFVFIVLDVFDVDLASSKLLKFEVSHND